MFVNEIDTSLKSLKCSTTIQNPCAVKFNTCTALKVFIIHLLIYGFLGPLGLPLVFCWSEKLLFMHNMNLTRRHIVSWTELLAPALLLFCIVKLRLDKTKELFRCFVLALCYALILIRALYKAFKFGYTSKQMLDQYSLV